MKTRAVFEYLGFEEDWEKVTDQSPAYTFDFGNLRLLASEMIGSHFRPCFHLSGIWRDARTITTIDFQLPLDVESLEQGVALVAHAIGKDFQPLRPTIWLEEGRALQDRLPWIRSTKEYEARPSCSVEREWFKVVAKRLQSLAHAASESDVVWFAFDGEILRIAGGGGTAVVSAVGVAWPARYAVRAAQLGNLPKRLRDPVLLSVWDGRLHIGGRYWHLVGAE